MEIKAITNREENFFFGFHDISPWNFNNDKFLALRAKSINSPPVSDEKCDVGYFLEDVFIKVATTCAFNYPQGSRQQWIGKEDKFIYNDKSNKSWISKIVDLDSSGLIETLNYSIYTIDNNGWAYTIDYERLHRVGGYGYTGIKDSSIQSNSPSNSGIYKHNIYTKENGLLISINQVSNFEGNEIDGFNHYITHLVLNPEQTRLAFLHRYKLADGGEMSRLMTIQIDGTNLKCLGTGFLSHFDWLDNSRILIWGRINSSFDTFRSSVLLKYIPGFLLSYGKKTIKKFIRKSNNSSISLNNWLILDESVDKHASKIPIATLDQDGHPMICPTNRDWMICDTYPDTNGIRKLFLFQFSTNKKIVLGEYQMIDTKPDYYSISDALSDVDPKVIQSFSLEKMAFFRSGLHCDLHPRWNMHGSMIAFDSIHEGYRNIYIADLTKIL